MPESPGRLHAESRSPSNSDSDQANVVPPTAVRKRHARRDPRSLRARPITAATAARTNGSQWVIGVCQRSVFSSGPGRTVPIRGKRIATGSRTSGRKGVRSRRPAPITAKAAPTSPTLVPKARIPLQRATSRRRDGRGSSVACASVLSPEAARELGRVRSRQPTCAAAGQAHASFALARIATSVRDSRATVHGGSERFQAVGEAGLRPASLCLIPLRCWRFRLSAEGEGFEPPRDLTAPCGFRDCTHFAPTMPADAWCATQRATVLVGAGPSAPRGNDRNHLEVDAKVSARVGRVVRA